MGMSGLLLQAVDIILALVLIGFKSSVFRVEEREYFGDIGLGVASAKLYMDW